VGTLLSFFSHSTLMAIVAASRSLLYHQPDSRLSSAGRGASDVPIAGRSRSMVAAHCGRPFYLNRGRICNTPEQISRTMAGLPEIVEASEYRNSFFLSHYRLMLLTQSPSSIHFQVSEKFFAGNTKSITRKPWRETIPAHMCTYDDKDLP
jgi:hypothetical protein